MLHDFRASTNPIGNAVRRTYLPAPERRRGHLLPMSKRKSCRKVAPVAPVWSDLEETFFAAAPPDDPEPVAEDFRFDDVTGELPPRTTIPPWLRRALEEAQGLLDPERRVWVVLATLLVLVGLSAAVFH